MDATLPSGAQSAALIEDTLHEAARSGDTVAIARLLDKKADIHAPDEKGRTPLLVAAREGQMDAARLLLEAGAQVDARGAGLGVTPLMAATRCKASAPLVRLLLEAGADPNALAANGAGALAHAVLGGDIETMQVLLDAGADPNGAGAAASANTAPLWAAVALKRRDLVELLLARGAEVNTGNSSIGTPFNVAVTGGDAGIARMLLEAGADPLRPSLSNIPLLAVALRFTNLPMAQLLEEYGLSLASSDEPAVRAEEQVTL